MPTMQINYVMEMEKKVTLLSIIEMVETYTHTRSYGRMMRCI